MRIVLLVAAKDLRQRLRDRSAYIMGIGAPLLLALIISLAIGSSFTKFHTTFAVADQDHGPIAAAFVDGVLRSSAVARVATVRVTLSSDEARRLTRNDVDAAFIIPSGFSTAVISGQAATFQVVRSRSNLIGGQLGEALAQGFASRVAGVQLAVRTALAAGAPPDPVTLARQATAAPAPAVLHDIASGGRVLKPAAYFGPAMALFFLFFTVGLGARSLLAERATGTLARMRAAPIPAAAVVGGKALATFLLALVSVVFLLVASGALLGAHWGHPVAVLGLVVATVLAAMGILTLVMTMAKTEEQAGTYTSAVAIVLALLGGSFVPISFAPALLRRLALATPNGWALRAFTDLATGTRSLSTVTLAIGVCLAFAAVTGTVGLIRAPKVLAQ